MKRNLPLFNNGDAILPLRHLLSLTALRILAYVANVFPTPILLQEGVIAPLCKQRCVTSFQLKIEIEFCEPRAVN